MNTGIVNGLQVWFFGLADGHKANQTCANTQKRLAGVGSSDRKREFRIAENKRPEITSKWRFSPHSVVFLYEPQ